MRRSLLLLGVGSVLTLALTVPGCNLFNELGNAECSLAMEGDGGDSGSGGAGGGDGAGGAPDEGAGGAVAAGAGGAPGAGVGVGAGDNSDVGAGAGSGRSVPREARAPRHRPRHHKGGEQIGTAVSADCSEPATPMWIAPAPVLAPLTTTKLRQIAALNNIGVGKTGIQQSQAIGVAFEKWVLVTLGQIPRWTMLIPSPARAQANASKGGLPGSVIPEFVAGLGLWWAGELPTPYPKSMLFEVKAVTGAITMGTSQYQILGLVDVASRSPAGVATEPGHPPPAVVFTTTGNTTIAQSMLADATVAGVAIWQQIVEYDTTSANPNNPDLYIEIALPLNQSVYGTASVAPNPGAWPHSPLTSPTLPNSAVVVAGDPDPAEVD